MTVTEKSVPLYTHHQKHNTPTMGDVGHGLYRRPWWSVARSGAMRVIFTSWATPGTLGLFYFARGGEFYNTFDQCTLKRIFANMGYVRHGLCHRLWLSAARSGAIHLLDASCAMSGTFGLFHFALWGLLGVLKCDPSKKEKGRVPWPLMATV
jgi:hypothetical protein